MIKKIREKMFGLPYTSIMMVDGNNIHVKINYKQELQSIENDNSRLHVLVELLVCLVAQRFATGDEALEALEVHL